MSIKLSLRILPLAATLMSATACFADALVIAPNETLTVTTDKLLVEKLQMGDKSKLIVDSPNFELHALDATFGRDVEIIGVGKAGTLSSAVGADRPGQADYCAGGAHGGNGGDGMPGAPGPNIKMFIGLQSLGSLKISSIGGRGGDGARGGNGQMGGAAKGDYTCSGGNGGNGGVGGAAGRGGQGGDISFQYWNMLDENALKSLLETEAGKTLLEKFTIGLQLETAGGANGNPGPGGAAAAGGSGREKKIGFAKFKRAPGSTGATGHAGSVPSLAVAGKKIIAPIPKP